MLPPTKLELAFGRMVSQVLSLKNLNMNSIVPWVRLVCTFLLGTEKNPMVQDEKNGIYRISCENFPCTCIEQAKRLLSTQVEEYLKQAEL